MKTTLKNSENPALAGHRTAAFADYLKFTDSDLRHVSYADLVRNFDNWYNAQDFSYALDK